MSKADSSWWNLGGHFIVFIPQAAAALRLGRDVTWAGSRRRGALESWFAHYDEQSPEYDTVVLPEWRRGLRY